MEPRWLETNPVEPVCEPGADVHVWRAALDLPAERLAALATLLSADERARAERFVRAPDRQRFIAARGQLRVLLGRYLQRPPDQLVFTHNEYGKPALPPLVDTPALAFNVTRRAGLALYAVTRRAGLALYAVTRAPAVGIDVEALAAPVELETLWPRIASAAEQTLWQALPAAQRRPAFFQLWTRKEAVIKALGVGLSYPLASLTVLGVDEARTPDATWRLLSFQPHPGYLAALATTGQPRCRWFDLA